MTRDFDAVGVEYAFNRLLPTQESVDADTFRHGDPKELAAVVRRLARALDRGSAKHSFGASETRPGGNAVLLRIAGEDLRQIAGKMKARRRKDVEPADYHWEIVAALVSALGALL